MPKIKRTPDQLNLYDYPPMPTDPELDKRTVDLNEKARRKQTLHRGLAGLAIALTPLAYGYQILHDDIAKGKEKVSHSHSQIHEIYHTNDAELADTATVNATGLGTKDSSSTAELLTSQKEIGSIYAFEYSNRDLNTHEESKVIADKLREDGIKYVWFNGFSAGGPIMLAVAAEIQSTYPDIAVVGVTFNSSPIGEQSLTESSRRNGDNLNRALDIYPDLAYSDILHGTIEMYGRRDAYTSGNIVDDISNFKETLDYVRHEKIDNQKAASGRLISLQYHFIVSTGVGNNLRTLSENNFDKQRPLISYTYAENPEHDTVVDVVNSEHSLNQQASRYHPPYVSYPLDVNHADPGQHTKSYNLNYMHNIIPRLSETINLARGADRGKVVGGLLHPNVADEPHPN